MCSQASAVWDALLAWPPLAEPVASHTGFFFKIWILSSPPLSGPLALNHARAIKDLKLRSCCFQSSAKAADVQEGGWRLFTGAPAVYPVHSCILKSLPSVTPGGERPIPPLR